ncbi:uncharacterized protein HD556DRAFT_1503210 [Suillus plorans]|uniref:C2H2-type domain-containing protein n=1 Tax=Suillus plorans TaxID=116603 RepID=A0A9P7DRA5_9AGAM|nr:uncharacterized protein HD556DRAFT_1503210 [Suillus plorans]KAG1801034.1 hypothetical protein HD556DRAFT_1503210 [Suillus plorans]
MPDTPSPSYSTLTSPMSMASPPTSLPINLHCIIQNTTQIFHNTGYTITKLFNIDVSSINSITPNIPTHQPSSHYSEHHPNLPQHQIHHHQVIQHCHLQHQWHHPQYPCPSTFIALFRTPHKSSTMPDTPSPSYSTSMSPVSMASPPIPPGMEDCTACTVSAEFVIPAVPTMYLTSSGAHNSHHPKCKTFNVNLIPCPHPGCSCTFKNRSGLTQHRHTIHSFSFEMPREAPLSEPHEDTNCWQPANDGDIEMDDQPVGGETNNKTLNSTHCDYHLQLDTRICDEVGNFIHPNTPPPPYTSRAPDNWTPYHNQTKFETAKFLYSKVQMSAGDIDKLMQLWGTTLAKHNDAPPFSDHCDLYSTINNTPVGDVPWKCFSMRYNAKDSDMNKSAPWMDKTYTTWFHDPRTIIHNVLANPYFMDAMDYVPYREFVGEGDDAKRQWRNPMSDNWAWDQVDEIAKDPHTHGATFVPVILGSDKTTVSVATGQNNYYPLDDECCARWPVRQTKPTTTLLQHSEKMALPSQTKAINAFRAAEAVKLPDTRHASNAGADQATPSISLNSPPGDTAPSGSSSAALEKDKRTRVEEVLDDKSGGKEHEDARTNPRQKRLCKLAAPVDDLVDNDGIPIDVDVQPIADMAPPTCKGKTADLNAFFGAMFDHAETNGKVKKHQKCKICLKQCILVNESTTLRRHAEANFAGKYRQWAKKHSFESMLPGDIKAQKEKAEQVQQTINSHLTERKLAE